MCFVAFQELLDALAGRLQELSDLLWVISKASSVLCSQTAVACLGTCLLHKPSLLSPACNNGMVDADEEVEVSGMPHAPTMEYKVEQGRQGRFIIRSCFGGADCTFVAAGSEVGWYAG